jgi:hypothetical protein
MWEKVACIVMVIGQVAHQPGKIPLSVTFIAHNAIRICVDQAGKEGRPLTALNSGG